MPAFVKEELNAKGVAYTETTDLEGAISQLDVLYMSRVQRERFISEEEYLRLKDYFILSADRWRWRNRHDRHAPAAAHQRNRHRGGQRSARGLLEQVRYGMFVRMALIMKLLGAQEPA
jgi:aspartate carbamoyltransferase catalytic subunit